MHAYIIVGDLKDEIDKKIQEIVDKNHGKLLEFTINKISEVRNLNYFLSLTQPENTLILLRNIETCSVDSLNAFLKNLEEPQKNITFILTAVSEYKVLPTILSRCQIIRIKNSELGIKNEINEDKTNFLDLSIGEKFILVDKIKKREEAVEFIKNTLTLVHKNLLNENTNLLKHGFYLKSLQDTLDGLNQNGNVTIQLTNLVVKLDN